MATFRCALVALFVAMLPALATVVGTDNIAKGRSSSQRPNGYSVTADVVNTTSVTLKWTTSSTVQDDVTCPVRLFLIRLKQDESRRVRTWKVDGSRNSVSLHGLHAGTTYYVRIVAVVCDGRSKPSKWVTVHTATESQEYKAPEEQRETLVPGQPLDVSTRTFADSVLVTWKAPESGGIVRGYVIGYGEGVPDVSWQYLDANRRNVTIRNLKGATQYVISARAFNNVGKGAVVYELVYTTDSAAVPSAGALPLTSPTNLHSKVLSSTTIWLQWTDQSLGRQQLVPDSRYYNVHYQAIQPMGKALSAVARDLHVILYNLVPATLYEFKVRAVKDAQTSHYTPVITNRTFETVPSSAPRDVKVTPLDDDVKSVRLSWRHPRHANGNITEYLVFYTWNEALPYEKWQVKQVVGPYTETTLYGLNATATTYYFRVQARNTHGFGPKSDIVKLTVDNAGEVVTVIPTKVAATVENIPTSSTLRASPTDNGTTSAPTRADDSEDNEDNEDDDTIADTHYDYIDDTKPVTDDDVTEPNDVLVQNNMTSSEQKQLAQSGAAKAKRVTSLLSPSDPEFDLDRPVSQTQPIVALQATVSHHVTAFITWPSAVDTCQSRQPASDAAVVGYQLRYRALNSGGNNNEYIMNTVKENVALLEGLAPNTRYRYQVRYVRRGERENGWSNEAEFDTGTG